MLRPLIEIDEERCNGCGKCITDCAEGALAIVNGKAKLISETYCDGLGACLNCPQEALKLVMKEAPAFDEEAAMAAKNAREKKQPIPFEPVSLASKTQQARAQLPCWPIQLELLPARASWLENANILLAAHCSAFALPDFHAKWLKDHIPVIACPKLENREKLAEKLTAIIRNNNISSLTILRMSMPCCAGLEKITAEAIEKSASALIPRVDIVQL